MCIFFISSMCFPDPHLYSKIPKIYHSGVHRVCFRVHFIHKTVFGFLRRNSFEKCVTRWSILFICNTFSCWLVLLFCTNLCYFVHWVSTGVPWEPPQCSLTGTIFPNLKFISASICATRPVTMQSDEYSSCLNVKRRGVCRSVDPNRKQPKTVL